MEDTLPPWKSPQHSTEQRCWNWATKGPPVACNFASIELISPLSLTLRLGASRCARIASICATISLRVPNIHSVCRLTWLGGNPSHDYQR